MSSKMTNCYEVCGSTISEGIKPILTGNLDRNRRDLLSIAHGQTSLTPIQKYPQPDFSKTELQKIFGQGICEAEFVYQDNQLLLLDKDADSDSVYVHVKSLFVGEHLKRFALTDTSLKTGKLKILFLIKVNTNLNDWSVVSWPLDEPRAAPAEMTSEEQADLKNQVAYFLEARPGAHFQTIEWPNYTINAESLTNDFVVTKSGRLKLVSSSVIVFEGGY